MIYLVVAWERERERKSTKTEMVIRMLLIYSIKVTQTFVSKKQHAVNYAHLSDE